MSISTNQKRGAYLTFDNLRNGYLTYYRRKTGGRLDIRWEQQMPIVRFYLYWGNGKSKAPQTKTV
ncbi:MAG: hypothetical protein IKL29_05040 [Bacteroidaceae bacterium]|nr:hypothetical protein [Bacteroidaceae bacterium]